VWLGTKQFGPLSLFLVSVTVSLLLFKLTMEGGAKSVTPQADPPTIATDGANTEILNSKEQSELQPTLLLIPRCESA